MNKLKILLLLMIIISSTSCNLFNQTQVQAVKIAKDVNLDKKANIVLNIKGEEGLKTKANSAGVIKFLTDVQSYRIFLTTNYNDPFALGANPFGNGSYIELNSQTTGSMFATFNGVPVGGPYFAVAAVFDAPAGSPINNNITKVDPTILSASQQWARSTNSVIVNPSGTTTYSNNGNWLDMSLTLIDIVPPIIDTNLAVNNGTSIPNNPVIGN